MKDFVLYFIVFGVLMITFPEWAKPVIKYWIRKLDEAEARKAKTQD